MSKRKAIRAHPRGLNSWRKRGRVLALALCLLSLTLSLARVDSLRTTFGLAPLVASTQAPSPAPRLTKEYVYAGGRLIAVEEAATGVIRTPYPDGAPHQVPGTVQVEDFDEGGEGVTYHDVDPQVANGTYRPGGVYIENCGNPDGGCNVGSTWGGEWLEYTVAVAAAGAYTLEARVASGSGAGGTFRFDLDGSPVTGLLTVPDTGGWESYQTVTASVTLPAGVHVMRLALLSNGSRGAAGNFNYFKLTPAPVGSAPGGFLATAQPGGRVILTWEPPPQSDGSVDHYELERRSGPQDASPHKFNCATSPCPDPDAAPGNAYLYAARAVFAGGGASPYTAPDLAVTAVFADDPLNGNSSRTTVKALHFAQLREAVNAARAAAGLTPFDWTDPAPRSGGAIHASHYNDLRANLGEALTKLRLPAPRSEPARSREVVTSKPVQELRDLMR